MELRAHWDDRYRTVGSTAVSWYEPEPTVSLELLDLLGVGPDRSVIDVGGGASLLVDRLWARGHRDLAVLDLSAAALDEARARCGPDVDVTWIAADVLAWTPPRRWDVWHDRAVSHFLTGDEQRAAYARTLAAAVAAGGAVIIGGFASDGPTQCSGLDVRRQSFDDLAELVADAGAEVVERRHHVHVTPAGGEQSFAWIAARVPDTPDVRS